MYNRFSGNPSTITWAEQYIYGSGRLGSFNPAITWTTASTYSGPHYSTTRKLLQGQKRYELSNHLGNVLATINDRRVPQDGAVIDNVAEFYTALTLSAQDYYPFGMEMPGRTFVLGAGLGSRYGFNGKEKDPSEFGSLTHYDYGFRIYNPAIGKFLSVDPLRGEYPWYTPYQFAGNMPIKFFDRDGLEPATDEDKRQAANLVQEFKDNPETKTVWNNISKDQFSTSLSDWLADPSIIDQASTNLCGIAAACKSAIEHDPVTFTKMAISLYQTGSFGTYKSNEELYEDNLSNGLDATGFVVMTTLRHSLNGVLDYDPKNDNGTSGFGWPSDIDHILTKTMDMKKTTGKHFGLGFDIASGIESALAAKNTVILLVNADAFLGKGDCTSLYPDHYVQVQGMTRNSDGTIKLNWWTWGEQSLRETTFTSNQLFRATFAHGSFE